MLNAFFIVFTLFVAFFLVGCTHEKIKFYRESQASSVLNKINEENNKPSVKKSSGMIIYKDSSSSSATPINFGPKDLIFDMPSKFK